MLGLALASGIFVFIGGEGVGAAWAFAVGPFIGGLIFLLLVLAPVLIIVEKEGATPEKRKRTTLAILIVALGILTAVLILKGGDAMGVAREWMGW